jgi:hypothetical protein
MRPRGSTLSRPFRARFTPQAAGEIKITEACRRASRPQNGLADPSFGWRADHDFVASLAMASSTGPFRPASGRSRPESRRAERERASCKQLRTECSPGRLWHARIAQVEPASIRALCDNHKLCIHPRLLQSAANLQQIPYELQYALSGLTRPGSGALRIFGRPSRALMAA